MTPIKRLFLFSFLLLCIFPTSAEGQIQSGVYFSIQENTTHELKISDGYLIHSVYERSPAKFISTVGGKFTDKNNRLFVALEFNSDFEKDGTTEIEIPYQLAGDALTLITPIPLIFTVQKAHQQELDAQWLFATRGPDAGQERRGERNTRKTLKFLKDGRFQWIAYDTDGMKFKGSGGGSFTAKDGLYQENIEYFSRDNARVGARLEFNYEIKANDWHHKGNNSKGEPLYEIWAKR